MCVYVRAHAAKNSFRFKNSSVSKPLRWNLNCQFNKNVSERNHLLFLTSLPLAHPEASLQGGQGGWAAPATPWGAGSQLPIPSQGHWAGIQLIPFVSRRNKVPQGKYALPICSALCTGLGESQSSNKREKDVSWHFNSLEISEHRFRGSPLP